MVAVGYPWLRAVQQSGEYDCWTDAGLNALLQMLVVPYTFVEITESAVCLGQSVYFLVDFGVLCTPQKDELMNCFPLSSINGNVGRAVLFNEWRLVEDLSLLQADLESEELGRFAKQEDRYYRALLVWATRVASSVKRRSQSSWSSVFVWACSLLRLNRLPSRR